MTAKKTIPASLLDKVTQIVTHAHCADGMASAILLFDALQHRDPRVRFLRPGSAEHAALAPEPGMLLCDIAPHPDRAGEFASSDVIVLDHHKNSKQVIERCPYGIFADETDEPGVSGAMLALRHVWWPLMPGRPQTGGRALDFATLIGISDTGQTHHPRWRQARALSAVLHFDPAKTWLEGWCGSVFDQPWWAGRLALGASLLEKQDEAVRSASRDAVRFQSTRGTRVVVVNSLTVLTDMAASEIETDFDLIVGFHLTVDEGKPTIAFSMRSRGYNCSAFAVCHGGGGHTRAAGFQHTLVETDPNPYALLRAMIDQYEQESGHGH